jgi:peptide/nickel transport system permease protein
MGRYLFGRIIEGMITLIVASIIIFGLARLTGNPLDTILPEDATKKDYELMARHLGLDKPLPVQYWKFITQMVRGDWGISILLQTPVKEEIFRCFPVTLKLASAAALISFLIALPAGVLAAIKRERWQDIVAKGFAILGQSVPSFWLGIILIQLFAVQLGLLPAGGYGDGKITHWILPAFTLGYVFTAGILRMTRSVMLDILGTDFVRLARIKGVSEGLVIWKHAFRNALIPVVTFAGLIYANMLMGSVVTETIFGWPGLGRLAYTAVKGRDFPLIQGIVIILVALYIVFNLAIDILYCYLDPRIRYVKE